MREIILQLAAAFFGSMGFALMFNINKKYLLFASLNGVLCWGIYLIVQKQTGNIFLSSFAATMAVTIVSEIQARIVKCPSTPFYISGLIPLIPGSSLYYMISGIAAGDQAAFSLYGRNLIWTLLGIAAAFGCLISTIHLLRNIREKQESSERKA